MTEPAAGEPSETAEQAGAASPAKQTGRAKSKRAASSSPASAPSPARRRKVAAPPDAPPAAPKGAESFQLCWTKVLPWPAHFARLDAGTFQTNSDI